MINHFSKPENVTRQIKTKPKTITTKKHCDENKTNIYKCVLTV